MLARLLCVVLFLFSTGLFAQEKATDASVGAEVQESAEPKTLPPPSSNAVAPRAGSAITTTNPFLVLFGLAVVVLLIFVSAWLMKRLGAGHFGGSGIKIVAGVAVGPREKVLLLDVGGRQTLIGVAPGRVSHLQSFESPVLEVDAGSRGDFSHKLKGLMQGQFNAGGRAQ